MPAATSTEERSQLPYGLAYPPAQAAIVSGRTRTRIFGAIRSGELKARKDGKATIIEHDELIRWIKSFPRITPRINQD